MPESKHSSAELNDTERIAALEHMLEEWELRMARMAPASESPSACEDVVRQQATELQRASESLRGTEAALQRQSERLDILSMGARVPLESLFASTAMLMGAVQDPAQRERVDAIRCAAEALRAVLQDLVEESGNGDEVGALRAEEFHAGRALEETLRLFEPLLHGRGILVESEVDGSVPQGKVIGDEALVRQVLVQLLDGGPEITGSRRIRIRFAAEDVSAETAVLVWAIEPTGGGRSELEASALDLGQCRRLVALMGGRVDVEDTPEGLVRLRVAVPFELAEGSKPAQPSQGGAAAQQASGHVLVVEDNLVNQRVACSILRRAGLETSTAANGQAALELLEQQTFDVVLMDCEMPILDGYDATRALRRRERLLALDRTPVVALTANTTADERQHCLDSGMDDFLPKPASSAVLVEKVREWIRCEKSQAA